MSISPHRISSTSYIKHLIYFLPLSFLDLDNDVKSIITEHVSGDYKNSTMLMSKHYELQKSLFGGIVFDHDFHKSKTTTDHRNDDNDLSNAIIYKICNVLNDIL
jgi:hypothetical protein